MSRLLSRRHFVLSGLTAAAIPLLAACSAPAPAAPTAAPQPIPTSGGPSLSTPSHSLSLISGVRRLGNS